MIAKAVNNGVPVERLAAALHKAVKDIKEWLNMLKGISPEAVELLKDKQICPGALHIFRKVLGMRQIEIAELMISANNYTKGYAEALLLGTPKDMLVDPGTVKLRKRISREELARMEFEMANLERDSKASEVNYGDKMLNLTVLRAYVRKLLENTRIKPSSLTAMPKCSPNSNASRRRRGCSRLAASKISGIRRQELKRFQCGLEGAFLNQHCFNFLAHLQSLKQSGPHVPVEHGVHLFDDIRADF